MNKYEKVYFNKLIKRMLWLDDYAEVDYMCYYLKISESEFWEKYLNKYIFVNE